MVAGRSLTHEIRVVWKPSNQGQKGTSNMHLDMAKMQQEILPVATFSEDYTTLWYLPAVNFAPRKRGKVVSPGVVCWSMVFSTIAAEDQKFGCIPQEASWCLFGSVHWVWRTSTGWRVRLLLHGFSWKWPGIHCWTSGQWLQRHFLCDRKWSGDAQFQVIVFFICLTSFRSYTQLSGNHDFRQAITNFPFVPTLKVVTTSGRFNILEKDMDINAGLLNEGWEMHDLAAKVFNQMKLGLGQSFNEEASNFQ